MLTTLQIPARIWMTGIWVILLGLPELSSSSKVLDAASEQQKAAEQASAAQDQRGTPDTSMEGLLGRVMLQAYEVGSSWVLCL